MGQEFMLSLEVLTGTILPFVTVFTFKGYIQVIHHAIILIPGNFVVVACGFEMLTEICIDIILI